MSAVVEIIEAPFKAVEAVGNAVGNVVSDVGNFVVEKVVEPVAKAVDNTIQAAINDPIGTAVKIAAISTGNPYIIAAANTGVALAHGADPEDALKAGAKAAIMYEVGSAVGDYVAPEAAEYFGPDNAAAASAVTNAAASTAAAAAVGEDPYQALLTSGVSSAAGVIAKQVPGYESLSSAQQKALKTTIAASLQGKDPSQALVNQALQVGVNYLKNKDDGSNYGYEQAPAEEKTTTQDEVDALINSGLTEDDGSNYGYEQAPEPTPETDKEPPEVTTAPVDIETDKTVVDELPPLDTQDLPPVTNVDLPEDDGSNYGYEQAPDSIPDTGEKLPEVVVAPPVKDEISDLVDSGLVEDAGTDYGYEQAAQEETEPPVESITPTAPDSGESLSEVVVTPPKDDLELLAENGLVEPVVPPVEISAPEAPDSGESLSEVVVTPSEDDLEPLIDSGLIEDDGSNYGYEQAPDYKPPVPSKPVISVPSKPVISVPSKPKVTTSAPPQQSANTLDDLMSIMQGAPIASTEQEELIKLVKASPYFDIRSPLNIGFFDQPNNQDPVKMAEGGYMDILFPKTQLTMDEILKILEGKYHG